MISRDGWLCDLRGVRLSVLMALVMDGGVCSAVDVAVMVGYSRAHVAGALAMLVDAGLAVRVHRTGWARTGTAVELIHNSLSFGDTLRQGNKRVHSMSDNVTLGENGRDQDSAQSNKRVHSMSQKVTLAIHDHDHDDDELFDYRVLCLEGLGFHDAVNWLPKQEGALVDRWLEWSVNLDVDGRKRFKNIGGFIRRSVESGKLPASKKAVPPGWEDVVLR